MATDKQKIFIIYTKLLNCVEDNYKTLNICPCLVEVLEEISSSDDMIQFVSNINSKSNKMATSLHDMLHSESSANLTTLYDFVILI